MSKIARMMQQATAGAGGAGLDVDSLFSTFLYDGGGSQDITNSIDFSNEGGMVWIKARDDSTSNHLYDTERGVLKRVTLDTTEEETTDNYSLSAFYNNGFRVLSDLATIGLNKNNKDYVSWSWRKAENWFDIQTYTGNGSSQTISHNLGCEVGMMFIKKLTGGTANWMIWHRSLGGANKYLRPNTSPTGTSTSRLNNTLPTSSGFTVGNDGDTNSSGANYVCYLFAHNNNDGKFGPSGDQDIVKCGTYTGNGSTQDINLGFEPQWIIIKTNSTTGPWYIWDSMRGVVTGGDDWYLRANESGDEGDANNIKFNSTGFSLENSTVNANAETYVYMAIRRGPLAAPTDATKVFAMDSNGLSANSEGVYFTSNFPVDFTIMKERTHSSDPWYAMSRLQGSGNYLDTANTTAESGGISNGTFDHMTGWMQSGSANMSWMWKRAPGYFDVVAYTGDFTTSNSIAHNLGVAPEMMWIRRRDAVEAWQVPVLITSSGYRNMRLDTTYEGQAISSYSDYTGLKSQPTSTNFVLGQNSQTNASGGAFIAYLFATVAGVSKLGSFSHTYGGTTNVDCGFSSGVRFLIIKRYSTANEWMVFDSVRGIVSGDDARLQLDSNAEENNGDYIDPYASGFSAGSDLNTGDYIFYAIA